MFFFPWSYDLRLCPLPCRPTPFLSSSFSLSHACKHDTPFSFRKYGASQINYILGDCCIDPATQKSTESFMVGFGDAWPMSYHHRASKSLFTWPALCFSLNPCLSSSPICFPPSSTIRYMQWDRLPMFITTKRAYLMGGCHRRSRKRWYDLTWWLSRFCKLKQTEEEDDDVSWFCHASSSLFSVLYIARLSISMSVRVRRLYLRPHTGAHWSFYQLQCWFHFFSGCSQALEFARETLLIN